MIRIVGVQRSDSPEREFILLQNQGGLRVNIRGHVIVSDHALDNADLSISAHAFGDDAVIAPGMYVLLFSGQGEPRWNRTKDGAMVFYTYMNRLRSVWNGSSDAIHVLKSQHTYEERHEALQLR